MSINTNDLLSQFGRLFANRGFTGAAMQAGRFGQHHGHGHHGDNRGQLRLMQLLADGDGISNAEIAEALDIRPSSVSMLVKKLEDAGIIERHASANDKRVLLIFLTDAGKQLIASGRSFSTSLSAAVFAGLSEGEQAQLLHLITKLADSLPQDFHHFHGNADYGDLREQARHLRDQFGRFNMRGSRNGRFDTFNRFFTDTSRTDHEQNADDDFDDF